MKATTSFIAVMAALATTAVATPLPEPVAAPALEARADLYFTYWVDVDFKGSRGNIKNPENFKCYDLSGQFQDSISSAGPTKGLVCTLWENFGCGGASVTLRNPGSSNLNSVNFNDRASSFQCATE